MRQRLARPGAALGAVVLVLGAGLGAATATAPDVGTRSGPPAARGPDPVTGVAPAVGRLVPLARAGVACPDPVAGETTATRVMVAAPGGPGDRAGGEQGSAGQPPGRFTLGPLGGAGFSGVGGQAPASVVRDAAPEQGPLVARGVDGSAPGLTAGQLTRSTEATMRGLAGVTCAASGTDAWFVGSGALVGQRGRVYLSNIEAAPAVVDVVLYGPDGPIDAPDARGVTVAPGAQEVRLLDALAPGTERFAVHVHARQGRIAAAVRDVQVDGLTPLGADWVPPAAAPGRRAVVAGVPGGPGERRLQIVAPGDSDAIVRVRLIGSAGTVVPPGLDVVEVRAGTVTDVDIAPFTGGEPVSVELVADEPVAAGVLARVTGGAGRLGEIAYAAAALPLTPATPGVAAQARQGGGVTSTLLLTAAAGEATVQLRALPPATGTVTEVRVPAGSLVLVDLATLSTAETFAFTVTPVAGSAPVLAVRQVDEAEARGPFVTSSPVEPGRYAVPVPRVVADLSAGLRAG